MLINNSAIVLILFSSFLVIVIYWKIKGVDIFMGNALIFIGLLVCIPSFIFGIPIALVGFIIKAIEKNKPQQATTQPAIQQPITKIKPPQGQLKQSIYLNSLNTMATGMREKGVPEENIERAKIRYTQGLANENIIIVPD